MSTTVSVQATADERGEWLDLARGVESAGFDTLYAPDHPGTTGSPFVALACVAAVTERINLGTWFVNAGVWDPLALASSVATLDVLAAGRAVLEAPRPVREHVPLLVGGNGRRVIEFAARQADIVGMTGAGRTLDDGHHHEVDSGAIDPAGRVLDRIATTADTGPGHR